MWKRRLDKPVKPLRIEYLCLYSLGINVIPENGVNFIASKVRLFLLFTTALLIGSSMTCYAIQNYKDISEFAMVVCIIIPYYAATVKIIILILYGSDFVHLVRTVRELGAKVEDPEELDILHKENSFEQLIMAVEVVSAGVTDFIVVTIPLFFCLFNYFRNEDVVLVAPIKGLYPYNDERYLFLTLHFLLCAIFVFYITVGVMGFDGLYCWFTYNLSAHFKIVRSKLKHLSENFDERNLVDFERNLAKVFDYHDRIISQTNEFNELFSIISFVEVLYTCFEICFLFYMMGADLPTFEVFFVPLALTTLLAQLGLYCFCGEKVQTESESISNDIYLMFPWHKMTPRIMRCFLLPMVRSQRPVKISAYFFELNSNLWVSVLRAASSYSALLLAVNDKTGDNETI